MPTGGGGGGSVSGWPVAGYANFAANAGNQGLVGANNVWVSGFFLGYSATFAHITLNIGVADAAGLYDFGVYNKAGTLIADIGAQHLPSTGVQNFAIVQAAQTLQPGLYALGITGNSTTATFNSQGTTISWISNANIATSSSGALPASVGALTVAPNAGIFCFMLY